MDINRRDVDRVLGEVEKLGLINSTEHAEVLSVLDADFPFTGTLCYTDSVHAHIKVEDVDTLPHEALVALGTGRRTPSLVTSSTRRTPG